MNMKFRCKDLSEGIHTFEAETVKDALEKINEIEEKHGAIRHFEVTTMSRIIGGVLTKMKRK